MPASNNSPVLKEYRPGFGVGCLRAIVDRITSEMAVRNGRMLGVEAGAGHNCAVDAVSGPPEPVVAAAVQVAREAASVTDTQGGFMAATTTALARSAGRRSFPCTV